MSHQRRHGAATPPCTLSRNQLAARMRMDARTTRLRVIASLGDVRVDPVCCMTARPSKRHAPRGSRALSEHDDARRGLAEESAWRARVPAGFGDAKAYVVHWHSRVRPSSMMTERFTRKRLVM